LRSEISGAEFADLTAEVQIFDLFGQRWGSGGKGGGHAADYYVEGGEIEILGC